MFLICDMSVFLGALKLGFAGGRFLLTSEDQETLSAPSLLPEAKGYGPRGEATCTY